MDGVGGSEVAVYCETLPYLRQASELLVTLSGLRAELFGVMMAIGPQSEEKIRGG